MKLNFAAPPLLFKKYTIRSIQIVCEASCHNIICHMSPSSCHPVILSPRHIIIQQCDPLTDNIRIYRYADNKETFKPQIAGQKFPCFSVMVILIGIFQQGCNCILLALVCWRKLPFFISKPATSTLVMQSVLTNHGGSREKSFIELLD